MRKENKIMHNMLVTLLFETGDSTVPHYAINYIIKTDKRNIDVEKEINKIAPDITSNPKNEDDSYEELAEKITKRIDNGAHVFSYGEENIIHDHTFVIIA